MNEEDQELSKNYREPMKEYFNEFTPLHLKQLRNYYRTILKGNKGQPYTMKMSGIHFTIDFIGMFCMDIVALERESYNMKFNLDTGYLGCTCFKKNCNHKGKLLNVFRKTLTT